ncbi:MAG: tyrosine-type recombinase/integrase [Thermocrispum sp.]
MRLYADYLHEEYGDLDSDYVFVNLWGRPHGHPMSYRAVHDLVRRLRRRTSINFDLHWWRHTVATRLQISGITDRRAYGSDHPKGLALKYMHSGARIASWQRSR